MKLRTDNYKAFTLVELLTVIAIMAILIGILLPVLSHVKKQAQLAKSYAEITSLANAIRAYKTEYGYWPTNLTDETASINVDTYLVGLLQSDTTVAGVSNNNPRKIKFYEFPDASKRIVGGNFVDPLASNPYKVAFDADYDEKITSLNYLGSNITLNTGVAIYMDYNSKVSRNSLSKTWK